MSEAVHLGLLVATGAGAGLTGAVAGVASLVVYPGLLAFGLPPVAANVTGTVANVFGGIGASVGSRPELVGQRHRVRRLALVLTAGSALGAAVLLSTPPGLFTRIVPVFIGAASLAVFLRPRPHPAEGEGAPVRRDPRRLDVSSFLLGMYAGYFGAAAGTAMVAILLYLTGETVARANGVKNVILMFANAVAAVTFAVFGPVSWHTVVPVAVGFLIGGRLGPPVVRRMPVAVLRPVIAVCGLALAVRLGLTAWR
ncbi:MAG TPA: sulfite exporter TauE/SafE family protein [Acidimicrobiales bacterium]|nr:sulfite exporter TauE/SafE family protein [Acidimicrobiales bacterium]